MTQNNIMIFNSGVSLSANNNNLLFFALKEPCGLGGADVCGVVDSALPMGQYIFLPGNIVIY